MSIIACRTPLFAAAASATGIATTLTWLLGTVLLVAIVAHFIRVPYTAGLVVAGLALGVTGGVFAVPLSEGLILSVFLPALLFEAAYHLPWSNLRAELGSIGILAIPGVIVGTLVVGAVVHRAGLSWGGALLFGALIAATDPIAVLATFRQLGTPQRLSIIVEGESLFNDGTALVVFRLVLGGVLTGGVSIYGAGIAFVASVAGGVLFGLVVGFLAAHLLRHIDDYLVEISATLVLAYGTFIVAEHTQIMAGGTALGASPVIAVVALGLVMGNYAAHRSMSPETRAAMHGTWEFIGYVANSLIFLLIGLQIHAHTPRAHDLPLILWGIAGVLVSRALVVYGLIPIVDRISRLADRGRQRESRVPLSFQHVMIWGGLRGAVALAAALSIPAIVPERSIVLLMTFGVVIFTVLAQGLTIHPLVARLGLDDRAATARSRDDSKPAPAVAALQTALIAFFAASGMILVAAYFAAPTVFADTVPLDREALARHPPILTLFVGAVLALIAGAIVGIVRRWRWLFWPLLVACASAVLHLPVTLLQLAGIMSGGPPR